jgi:hypothetical protein
MRAPQRVQSCFREAFGVRTTLPAVCRRPRVGGTFSLPNTRCVEISEKACFGATPKQAGKMPVLQKQGARELPRELPFTSFNFFNLLTYPCQGRGCGVGRGRGVGVGRIVSVGEGVGGGGIDGVGDTVGVGVGVTPGAQGLTGQLKISIEAMMARVLS